MEPLARLARDEWLRGVVEGGSDYARPMLAEARLEAWCHEVERLGSTEDWPNRPAEPDDITGEVERLFRAMSAGAADGSDVSGQAFAQGWLYGYQALQAAYQASMVTEPWMQLVRRRAVPVGGRRGF